MFAVEAGGGILLGLAIGWIAFRMMRSIDDYKVEVLISLAVVMGGYAIARPLHASGPVAMAVAGLIIGNAGVAHAMSETTRDYLHKFWDLIDDILNTVLFLLIGLEVVTIPGDLRLLVLGVAAIPLALARAIAVGAAAAPGDPADASVRPGRAGDADLGRTARRHLDRAGARPAGRAGAVGDPGGDLRRRAVLGDRAGRNDQARAGTAHRSRCGENAMRARLLRLSNDLRESYWFVPTVMAIGALLLALAMVYIDSHAGSGWMDGLPWLYAARPDGARSLLSSIGGSMIGVAGTTFSVTIAAVVYASGQYGPRLLSNFMSDRGNQVTLGTFIATFVYSLVVLRTIRSAGESGAGAPAFVPQLALLVALVLVLCSIAVLIFFIHHVPMRIHINNVIERIGDRLIEEIDSRFPVFVGVPLEERT